MILMLRMRRSCSLEMQHIPSHGDGGGSPVVITLASNHVLDFGPTAFESDTVPTLRLAIETQNKIKFAGAGLTARDAKRGVCVEVSGRQEYLEPAQSVIVIAAASSGSGTPSDWAAEPSRSALFWLRALTSPTAVDDGFRRISAAFS
eukprot:GHVN01101090.1.p1 GENE.GHVN01101090.1~~GHVN01101090.1.p1  ORF type:complete len:147 (-),score=20.60 GHVN01101090.1:453-893(-)